MKSSILNYANDSSKRCKLSPKKDNNQNEKKLKNEIVDLKNAVNIKCKVIRERVFFIIIFICI